MTQTTDQRVRELHGAIFACLADGAEPGLAEAARLCGQFPEPSPLTRDLAQHALMETGFRLETEGNLALARPLYERLAEAAWADAAHRTNAQYRLALVRLELGDTAGSLEACQAAVAPDGDPHLRQVARLFLAHVLKCEHRWEEAAREFALVVAEVPPEASRFDVLLQLTTCLVRSGRVYSSITPLELPPPGSPISEMTARLWMEAGFAVEESGDLGNAAALYERLLEQSRLPGEVLANAIFRCGLICELRADWEAARRLYEAAIRVPQGLPTAQQEARKHLASLLLLLEEHGAAAQHLAVLCSSQGLSNAERAGLHLQQARCLFSAGAVDAALSQLEVCRSLCAGSETEVSAELLLAEIFQRQGDSRAAAECCRRIAEHPCAEPLTKAAALAYAAQAP